MSFIISKLFWFVFRPTNLLVLALAVVSWWGWLRTRSRVARAGAILATLLLLVALLPVGRWIAQPLEERFERPIALPEQIDGIIVLGGPQDYDITKARGAIALRSSAERLIEAAALARRHPEAQLVFTGGSGSIAGSPGEERLVNEMFVAGAALPQVPVHESRSRNTWENAVFSQELLGPKPGETWVMVTSAVHMPRAMGIFRRRGWEVIPWPVDYISRGDHEFEPTLDFSSRLSELDRAAREWVGLLAYHLMDRTPTLFPAPYEKP